MADVRGHGLINGVSEGFYVGADEVTAIYFGAIQVWPAELFGGDMLFLPDEGDA